MKRNDLFADSMKFLFYSNIPNIPIGEFKGDWETKR